MGINETFFQLFFGKVAHARKCFDDPDFYWAYVFPSEKFQDIWARFAKVGGRFAKIAQECPTFDYN